jgi:hypothetical protein
MTAERLKLTNRFFREKSHSCKMIATSLLVACCLSLGCDPDWPGTTSTATVSGTVSLDDLPLADAHIFFIPIMPLDRPLGEPNPMSYGKTDIHGKYWLKQSNGTSGAVTGQHAIIISKPVATKQDDSRTPLPSLLEVSNAEDVVPDFYRRDGYLKRQVMPLPSSQAIDFRLSSVDPLLRDDR